MITPYLEKLIHEGRAVWKNETIGLGQAYSLKIPDNCYWIITDFTYQHFIDSSFELTGTAGSTWESINSRSVHQIRFKSVTSDTNYVIKDKLNVFQDITGGMRFISGNDHTQYDCYQIHTDKLRIELCIPFRYDQSAPLLQTLQKNVQECMFDIPVNGVGNIINGLTVTTSQFQGAVVGTQPTYMIMFEDFQPLVGGGLAWNMRRLNFPFFPDNLILQPLAAGPGTFAPDMWRSMPIINISYVQVNEILPNKITGR